MKIKIYLKPLELTKIEVAQHLEVQSINRGEGWIEVETEIIKFKIPVALEKDEK